MPVIKSYSASLVAPETGFQRATPEAFGADVGAGLMAVGQGANRLYSHIEERESRDALVGSSEIRAKYAKLLDEAQLTGGDTQALKDSMEQELAKIGENFSTRKGQDSLALHTANTNLMFDEQANRIAVTRASADAQLQAKKQIDSDSATLRSNPSFLPMAEANVKALVSTFNLPPEKRALVENQMIEQLNMAAVAASSRIDPEGTIDKLESGVWTLTPEQRQQGIQMSQVQINARRADEEYARRLLERDKQERADASQLNLVNKAIAGTLTRREIGDDMDMSPQQKMAVVHFQQFLANARAERPHPREMMRLWRIYHDPLHPEYSTNMDPLLEATRRGGVNAREAEVAAGWVANQKDENNRTIGSRLTSLINSYGRRLSQDPRYMWPPELVSEIELVYQDRVFKKVNELREAKEQPAQVFDPKSKHYMGGVETVEQAAQDVRARHLGQTGLPEAGTIVVRDGVTWRFKGGKPSDPSTWEVVK